MMPGKDLTGRKTIRALLIFLSMILPGLGVYWSLEADQPLLSAGLLTVIFLANIWAVLLPPGVKTGKSAVDQPDRN
jgi:hypothetical protein